MDGKKILIGITGSIAAYKMPYLVRLLVKARASVKVVMTPAATDFVSPLVLSTLTRQEVHIDLASDNAWANHVELGRWADVMLIAPASCNTIAKMTAGICDNLLLSVYLSSVCPVMIAPAMDDDMWHHPATRRNLAILEGFGHRVIPSEHGELASGLIGMGRMAEPEQLFESLSAHINEKQSLSGKRALVTAGPTYESIDPVRFIGNHSSGKMGIALAAALAERGCTVDLVLGPTSLGIDHPLIHVTRVRSAAEMYDQAVAVFPTSDIAIMSAAVADYTPAEVSAVKLKKSEQDMVIHLQKTKDILRQLGRLKQPKQILVGFALESNNETDYALKKLHDKNADAIIMNSLNDPGAGFSHDTNKITIFEKNGKHTSYPLKQKHEVARDIVDKLMEWLP